jgi:hypothetical protein
LVDENGPPDDTRDHVTFNCYSTEDTKRYPTTAREFLSSVVEIANDNGAVDSWLQFEHEVFRIERIPIKVYRKPFAPIRAWEDYTLVDYPYIRAMRKSATVAAFCRTRLQPRLTYFRFEIKNPDGTIPGPQTRLATLREKWNSYGRVEPQPLPGIMEIARELRWVTYVASFVN